MEASSPQEFSDANYNPQMINEQDPPPGSEEQAHVASHGYAAAASPMDMDSNSRYNSPSLANQAQPPSRPGSGMSQAQQGQYQDSRPQQAQKSSVVIKVGMVGDAQIGKTSLMVKYVEGSWDEDYIQTLGIAKIRTSARVHC